MFIDSLEIQYLFWLSRHKHYSTPITIDPLILKAGGSRVPHWCALPAWGLSISMRSECVCWVTFEALTIFFKYDSQQCSPARGNAAKVAQIVKVHHDAMQCRGRITSHTPSLVRFVSSNNQTGTRVKEPQGCLIFIARLTLIPDWLLKFIPVTFFAPPVAIVSVPRLVIKSIDNRVQSDNIKVITLKTAGPRNGLFFITGSFFRQSRWKNNLS